MAPRRPISSADDLPRLRSDADRAINRYGDAVLKAEKVFFDSYGESLAPDLLRLIAVRLLEIADTREPVAVSGKGVARMYGWRKVSFVVRDAESLPTVHLINHLCATGYSDSQVADELGARRIATMSGRLGWLPRVVAAIAAREAGRQPVWAASALLDKS